MQLLGSGMWQITEIAQIHRQNITSYVSLYEHIQRKLYLHFLSDKLGIIYMGIIRAL